MNKVFDIAKEELEKYLSMHLTYSQIAEKYGCSNWTIMNRAKSYGLKSEARKYQMIEDNPMASEEIRNKVSEKIKNMWDKGYYDEVSFGGSLGIGFCNPNFMGGKYNYRDKAKYYYPEAKCLICGKQLSWDNNSIEVHHVDNNHDNFLLTNLQPLCHSCHKKYHRKNQPFVSITKSFVFDACHYLPYHNKKCKFLHGHTYHMDITIRNRINLDTGMVIDFGQLKEIVNTEIIELLDHNYINQFIEYPTCELMIIWIWKKLSLHLKGLQSIKVWETDGSYCEMTNEDAYCYMKENENEWIESNPPDKKEDK